MNLTTVVTASVWSNINKKNHSCNRQQPADSLPEARKQNYRMFNRILTACGCLLVLTGCAYNDEPTAVITGEYNPPAPLRPAVIKTPAVLDVPKSWYPDTSYPERKWTAIIIHHSGTKTGNEAIFDRWHRQGNHWEGVGYDFVIGNGTDSGDGQVEVTFRWQQQKTGAHCGGTAGNWANRQAVGICLVGNFNSRPPTNRQMQSLVKLIGFLQKRYNIPSDRIFGHRTTPGAQETDCPGKMFPMLRLKSMLRL